MAEHVEAGHGDAAHAHGAEPAHPPTVTIDFDKAELAQFDHDDVSAGGNIGRMLALFFVYTIVAMSIAGFWTYRSLMQ